MNPSYARIRLPLADALERFSKFVNPNGLEPPSEVSMSDAVTKSVDSNGNWLGGAKYVYHNDGWTVFEDLSGHLGACSAQSWLDFAGDCEFIFAGYKDAISYGELIVIRDRSVLREFMYDAENPDENVDTGSCPDVGALNTWVEVARFVDDDDIVFSETGLLWIHGPGA